MDVPRAPSNLSREAQGWWRKVVSGWTLDAAALLLLHSGLESFDRMREAQLALAADGIVIEDRFGQKKAHPAVQVEADSKAILLRTIGVLNLDIEPLHAGPGRPTV